MSTATQVDSSTGRRVALRMRGDLEFRPQQFATRRVWVVKDPVAQKFFHLGEEEYALLQSLDGRTSLEALKRQLDEAFAPRRVTVEQIQGYLATLHRYGLVLADAPGQGYQLLERRDEKRHRARWQSLASVLAIRFPGFNPRPLLDVVYPAFQWLFTPASYLLAGLLAVVALVVIASNIGAVEARLPDADAILAASNLPLLALSLAGVKVLHELAHAAACRRYGGECHEAGLMLLVFTPCLYCNVSESWMLPGKWQRIAVSAAGIYVELILASVAALLWYFSQEGMFHAICLNVVLICSLGTLLLNGNPLLRYDGYFILSDLVEVPNLREQASAALRRRLSHYVLGVEVPRERLSPAGSDWPLVAYALAAGIYRLIVVALVLWMLDRILRPLHLEVLVMLLGGVVLGSMLWPLAAGVVEWTRNPTRRRFAPARVALASLIVLAALAALWWLPIPRSVVAPLVLEYRDADRVYVTVDGSLTSAAAIGQRVDTGQPIARLQNRHVQLQLAQLRGELNQQRLVVANLESRQLQGASDGAELPAARAALEDLERRTAQAERDAERLELVAPRPGVLLPPPNVPRQPLDRLALQRWTGTPLDPINGGAHLETGTLVCLVGDPENLEAILHVDQHDVELVREGQQVSLLVDHLPAATLQGTVVELAKLDLDVMPRELAAAGDLPARQDDGGLARPLDTWYQARVRLDGEPQHLIARMHGRAKIEVASQTVGERLVRWLKQTFAGRA